MYNAPAVRLPPSMSSSSKAFVKHPPSTRPHVSAPAPAPSSASFSSSSSSQQQPPQPQQQQISHSAAQASAAAAGTSENHQTAQQQHHHQQQEEEEASAMTAEDRERAMMNIIFPPGEHDQFVAEQQKQLVRNYQQEKQQQQQQRKFTPPPRLHYPPTPSSHHQQHQQNSSNNSKTDHVRSIKIARELEHRYVSALASQRTTIRILKRMILPQIHAFKICAEDLRNEFLQRSEEMTRAIRLVSVEAKQIENCASMDSRRIVKNFEDIQQDCESKTVKLEEEVVRLRKRNSQLEQELERSRSGAREDIARLKRSFQERLDTAVAETKSMLIATASANQSLQHHHNSVLDISHHSAKRSFSPAQGSPSPQKLQKQHSSASRQHQQQFYSDPLAEILNDTNFSESAIRKRELQRQGFVSSSSASPQGAALLRSQSQVSTSTTGKYQEITSVSEWARATLDSRKAHKQALKAQIQSKEPVSRQHTHQHQSSSSSSSSHHHEAGAGARNNHHLLDERRQQHYQHHHNGNNNTNNNTSSVSSASRSVSQISGCGVASLPL